MSGFFISLSYARNPSPDTPLRVGVSVGKRVGGAVTRNTVKRRLREIMRRALPRLLPGWDVILTARPPATQATYAALEAETHALLDRAGLWNADIFRGKP